MKTYLLTLFACCLFLKAPAQLSTSKLFAEHMVLQRNQQVPVWGWATKKAKVTIDFNGQTVSAKADEQGNWQVLLRPMSAGGPYSMAISSGKQLIVYNDIMVGEVWLCSGQSNMEFALGNANGYKAEQKVAGQSNVRQFAVLKKVSLTLEKDVSGGQWVKADTNTVGDFTAVGYFFAKKLAQQLDVTVGIIDCTWGGTDAEDWISKNAMLGTPGLDSVARAFPATWDDLTKKLDKQLKAYAYKANPVTNYTGQQLAGYPAAFFDAWQHGNAPGSWEWMGKLYSYRGEGFMQKTIKLDSQYTSRKSLISLGTSDADMAIYINGKLIKNGALSGNFQLDLPAGTWKTGANSLLINLQSPQKNPNWFGIGLNGSGNDMFVRFNDTTVTLADANWRVMPDLSKPYHFDFLANNNASLVYNAMVHPLIPYAIAGVAWYQGESNAGRSYQYRTTFQLLINNWRNEWKQQLPFLFVQLPAFGGTQNSNIGSNWAELREAQAMALQLPETGMVVTLDVGEAFNLHPKNKTDVGLRLAGRALSMVYHLPGYYESPLFSSADFISGYTLVNFKHAEGGLITKDKYGYLHGFELAGADHKFYYAQAIIIDGGRVKVWCPQVPQPVAVRYGWTDAPVEADLFSNYSLPVGPFRSDNWKGITDGKKYE
jgi:sialate O-acetylesterase